LTETRAKSENGKNALIKFGEKHTSHHCAMGCCCSCNSKEEDDDNNAAATELAEVSYTISRAMSAPSIDVDGLTVSASFVMAVDFPVNENDRYHPTFDRQFVFAHS
jgi:hypothetical protein